MLKHNLRIGCHLTSVEALAMTLVRVSRRAMACEFEVCFPAGKCENGTELAIQSLDLVETLEEQLSFFRPTSEVSRVNCLAAETAVEVTPPLWDLLCLALRLYEETQGAYDITSVPLWEAWGFARRAGKVPSEPELAEARSRVGAHLVELDPAQRTIRFRKPGVRISLASIGKGYALDACAERLLALGMSDFLLHGGQSSVLARGSPDVSVDTRSAGVSPAVSGAGATPSLPAGWEVGLRDPRQTSHRLAIVRLRNRALGTSSGQFQSFRHRGRQFGHLLDPRSGWPAEGVLSTMVVAPSAAMADALSTAFYVMGPQPSLAYCAARPEIGTVMLCPSNRGQGLKLHRAGLNDRELVTEGGDASPNA
jgi:FAD:protein FMN transferase